MVNQAFTDWLLATFLKLILVDFVCKFLFVLLEFQQIESVLFLDLALSQLYGAVLLFMHNDQLKRDSKRFELLQTNGHVLHRDIEQKGELGSEALYLEMDEYCEQGQHDKGRAETKIKAVPVVEHILLARFVNVAENRLFKLLISFQGVLQAVHPQEL